LGDAGPFTLKTGASDHLNTPLSNMCYHTKFGRFSSNYTSINKGVPTKVMVTLDPAP